MASQCVVVLSLFLVLVGATMAHEILSAKYYPISHYNNELVQFLGKFVVNNYNKKGKSHMFFIQVVNGTVLRLPSAMEQKIWNLELKAINCSEPGSSPALYAAQVFENYFANMWRNQIEAYNTNFGANDVLFKL